jgi:dTMP kinase
VCDRYADSTEAYQGAGLALNPEVLHTLRRLVVGDLEPDLVLVMDLEPAAALERIHRRPGGTDHYEQMDLGFHQRVRAAFLDIAQRGGERYVVIDGTLQIEAVQAAVLRALERCLGLRLEL